VELDKLKTQSLTSGNLRKISQIMKFYALEENFGNFEKNYNEYENFIKNDDRIAQYLKISNIIHDGIIEKIEYGDDIVLSIRINDENIKTYSVTLHDGQFLSQNRILKSGKIARLNSKIIPNEYLYDEITTNGKIFYIAIAVTSKTKIRINRFYPILSFQFSRLSID
jgi:hypothetical protein